MYNTTNDENTIYLAHKIEIRPTNEQRTYLSKCCGIRRFMYNQCVNKFVVNYDPNTKFTNKAVYEFYNSIRSEYDWFNEVTSRAGRVASQDFIIAMKRFFKGTSKKPKFKKKGRSNESFSIRESEKFQVHERTLRIEKLKTPIKLRQTLRLTGTPKQVTISYKAGKWFATILVEITKLPKDIDFTTRKPSVGIDMGIKDLAVLSDGITFPSLNALKSKQKKLTKLQRKLAKQQIGSNAYNKTKLKIQKLHFYVVKQREAMLHEISDYVTEHYDLITIEDLNVKGMVKNRKLSRAISDVGFGKLREYIEYKAHLRGNTVVVADRFFPSSKMCSSCATIHSMPLHIREMSCGCGLVVDRDLNAAINLDNYGLKYRP